MRDKNQEPYAETGNPGEHRGSEGTNLNSWQTRIADKARKEADAKFSCLMHHLNLELIRECLNGMRRGSSPGVDGISVPDALEHLDWQLPPVLKAIHEGCYEAPPVRRVHIPKASGGHRPLGVPTAVDRAVQAGTAKILSQIYEQDYLPCSFGFRPGIGCHHAAATVGKIMDRDRTNFVLEVDIRDFFGSLSHEWLLKFLEHRISDQRILKLIRAWLKAGVMEDGKWRESERGTPQGGSISPLLANIYLHYVLDLWWEKRVRRRVKGRSYLVRYADDFIIAFQYREEAERVLGLLKVRLAQFGLAVAEEKTHITPVQMGGRRGTGRRKVSFLGFNIFRSRLDRVDGTKWKIIFRTEGKRFSRAKAEMKKTLIRTMHWQVEEQVKRINAVLRGHYNYYGLPGNSRRINAFLYLTTKMWRRCLSRRSQKGKVRWDHLNQILQLHPLAPARLKLTHAVIGTYVRL